MTPADRLVEALRATLNSMGMHGPCENNDCKTCVRAYEMGRSALAAYTAAPSDVEQESDDARHVAEMLVLLCDKHGAAITDACLLAASRIIRRTQSQLLDQARAARDGGGP